MNKITTFCDRCNVEIAKPILFNTEMAKAVLDNRKTVTRRVIKPHNIIKGNKLEYAQGNGLWLDNGYVKDYSVSSCWIKIENYINKYYTYNVGDYLYVRETYCWCPCWDCGMYTEKGCQDDTADRFYSEQKKENGCYGYKASFETGELPFDKWTPSIHMPKEAARIFLRVTDIRVERLQDITEEQAICEGCYHGSLFEGGNDDDIKARGGFIGLWDSTIKKADLDCYGWSNNPWVWVIEFERLIDYE